MGMEEGIIQIVNIGAIDSALVPDYFWYVFLIICPGYISGLTIFYFKYQTVDSWFDKSAFDKTIISILFGGLLVILVSLFVRFYYFVQGIKIVLNPEALSLIISGIIGILIGILALIALKRSEEEKLNRILKYEYEKRIKEFPAFVREDFIIEKVTKILSKYSKDYIWGREGDPDIAIPDFNNPKIFIEIKAIPTEMALRATVNKMKYLKNEFPDSKFVFIVGLSEWYPPSLYQKELISQFDAFFDISRFDDFEEYIKEQLEIKD